MKQETKEDVGTIVGISILVGSLIFLGFVIGESTSNPKVIHSETPIYTLAEKQKCNEWGGELKMFFKWKDAHFASELTLQCTKDYQDGNKQITETLFDYELNVND